MFVGENTRRAITLASAALTIAGAVIVNKLTESLSSSQSWGIFLAWLAAGIFVTYLVSRLQARSGEIAPETIKARVDQLHFDVRSLVKVRSYADRDKLIANGLNKLDLKMTPRAEWVRAFSLDDQEPLPETTDIVAAFESSKRHLLIGGAPGSGKTLAAYSLIEYLDDKEGAERLPLLVDLSAWEGQDDFEDFLVE